MGTFLHFAFLGCVELYTILLLPSGGVVWGNLEEDCRHVTWRENGNVMHIGLAQFWYKHCAYLLLRFCCRGCRPTEKLLDINVQSFRPAVYRGMA
jgi:hypothetical protein